MQSGGMLVSRVCHDLANSLSHLVFLREDIHDGSLSAEEGIKELCDKIEPLGLRIKFFQNITIQKEHIENLYEVLGNLCSIYNIKLMVQNKMSSSGDHPFYEENIVCGVLYILIDYAIKRKLYDELTVTFTDDEKITIFIPGVTADELPSELLDLTNTSAVVQSVQNALACYIRSIMVDNHYVAYVSEVRAEKAGMNFVICHL